MYLTNDIQCDIHFIISDTLYFNMSYIVFRMSLKQQKTTKA